MHKIIKVYKSNAREVQLIVDNLGYYEIFALDELNAVASRLTTMLNGGEHRSYYKLLSKTLKKIYKRMPHGRD